MDCCERTGVEGSSTKLPGMSRRMWTPRPASQYVTILQAPRQAFCAGNGITNKNEQVAQMLPVCSSPYLMNRFLFSALLAFSFIACGQTASPSTAAPASGEARMIPVERRLAVTGQGYFPVAQRLRDGRIAVVLRGGGPHLSINGRLDMIFSNDEGQTWSKPVVVNDSPIDDRNPALGEAEDGTIVVGFWRTATYDEAGKYNPKLEKERTTWVTRSKDGQTWSEPTQIDVSDIGLGSPFGRMVTLPDGTMLMAVYGYEVRPNGQKTESDRNHSYVYRSADDGRSWKRLAEIGDGKQQLNETALLRLPDGRISAALRSRAGAVWLSDSKDDGMTWSATKQLSPDKVHPADLCLLADGRVLMALGNRVGPFGVLGMVSDAAGKFDWEKRFALVTDAASGDCGYPSSVALKDGRALTLYYATRAKDEPGWGVHCGAVTYQIPQ
jgi:hypothetical protein